MAFTSLERLKSAIATGARSNLFTVTLAIPDLNDNGLIEKFQYLCKAAQLPGSTLGSIEIPFIAGRRYKIAGDRTFSDWTTTIMSDQNQKIRKSLEDLQRLYAPTNLGDVNAYAKRTGATDADFGTITVTQYDLSGTAVYKCELRNAWPSDISTIDLSYDSTDTLEEFTCTWSYDYFVYTEL
ncbi:MAG: hypothetical protein EBQ66_02455 [Flavobacteriia bacterium]|nr:hypothetical protein [Flavobacteriia bacterium]